MSYAPFTSRKAWPELGICRAAMPACGGPFHLPPIKTTLTRYRDHRPRVIYAAFTCSREKKGFSDSRFVPFVSFVSFLENVSKILED